MGKQLSVNKQGMSNKAALAFYEEVDDSKVARRVLVLKKNKIVFDSSVKINILPNSNFTTVHILWEESEDLGEDYHGLGLYGSYRTDYCYMQIEHNHLRIRSDNGIEIII